MQDKIEKEREFHNRRFGGEDEDRAKVNKYYVIDKYLNEYYNSKVLEVCKGAELLEYGCGIGTTAFEWAEKGAKVTGIDLSDAGIEKAKTIAQNNGLPVKFYQMNAEKMDKFSNESFDVITGRAILHHLDLHKAYSELSHVLKFNGRAVFIEPLGHNPIINLYRKLTPELRTEDEHPLTLAEVKLGEKYFSKVKTTHYHLLTITAVPFRNTFLFNPILSILNLTDRFLMGIFPFIKKYSWVLVIEYYK